MRALIALEIVVLLGSAGAAWDLVGRTLWDRPAPFDLLADRLGELDRSVFIAEDAGELAKAGEKERALGLALSGYDRLLVEDASNLEAIKGQLKTTLRISGAAVGQAGVPQLVMEQLKNYAQNIETLDPDGSFLRPLLREWCALRLKSPTLYNKAAVAIWLAAREDEAGLAKMRDFIAKGPFHHEYFPYAERFHPAWPATEPLIRHYLERGDLLGRVAAGATLLEYHYMYGVGKDLYDQHLGSIRAAFKELKGKIGPRQTDMATLGRGDTAIFGTGMLANRGFADEKRILAGMSFLAFPHNPDSLRVAQILAGIRKFSDYMPGTENWKLFAPQIQELYFRAAAHRVVRLEATGAMAKAPERDVLDKLLDYGFQSNDSTINMFAWRVLAPRNPDLGRQALERRHVFAMVLAANEMPWPERARRMLPLVSLPQPDYSALAVVTLLDLGDTCAIQRPTKAR